MTPLPLVFLVDVDNTPLDNDRVLAQRISPEIEGEPGARLGHDSSTDTHIRRHRMRHSR